MSELNDPTKPSANPDNCNTIRHRRNSKTANRESVATHLDVIESDSISQRRRDNEDRALNLIEDALTTLRSSLGDDRSGDIFYYQCHLNNLRFSVTHRGMGIPNDLNKVIEYLFYYLAYGGEFSPEILEAVVTQIINWPDAYIGILGTLFPAEMLAIATARRAEIAYARNQSKSAADDWSVFLKQLAQDRQRSSEIPGVCTGLTKLDDALQGLTGFTVVGGDSSIGIGTFATWATLNALRSDPNTSALIYSLDSPKSVVNLRLLSIESGFTSRQLTSRTLDLAQQEKLQLASSRLTKSVLPRLRILDGNCFDWQEDDFAAAMIADYRRLQLDTKTRRTLIVVDLLKDLPVPQEIEAGIESDLYRLEQLEQVLFATRTASDPIGAPLMVLSDITKGEIGRKKLRKEDLLGSGRLLSKANNILLMWPTEGASVTSDGLVSLTIDVAKGGPGVMRRELEVWHDSMHNTFSDAPLSSETAEPTQKMTVQSTQRLDPIATGRRRRKNGK